MSSDTKHQATTPINEVAIDVAQPGIRGILSINPDAQCFNLDRSGLRFGCKKNFEPGQRLILDVRAFNIAVNELIAVITNHEQLDNGSWCCEARFCFEEKHMKQPHVFHALLQIEDRLRSSQSYPTTI